MTLNCLLLIRRGATVFFVAHSAPLASMKCQNCLHENGIEAKFCEQCAAPLARLCAHCGSPASLTARFCVQCGQSLPSIADMFSRFGVLRDHTPQHLAEKNLGSRSTIEG